MNAIEKARAEVAALQRRNEELTAERDAWRLKNLGDKEAQAISECVAALDRLTGRNNTTSYSVTWGRNVDVKRLLRYLADRYGVDWYEPPSNGGVWTFGPPANGEWAEQR